MKVSFCIPTYNRAEYLEPLIESIANQLNHSLDIEICISDNASTDGTDKMITNWRKKFNIPIHYHRHHENIGPDRNFLSAVNMGTGDYCWIFGSDDILANEALSSIQVLLSKGYDIYLCDRKEMDISMKVVRNPHRKWLLCDTSTFVINGDDELVNYFNHCQSIGGVFSYLSSIIVKRNRWNAIKFDESYVGTAYSHVYILLRILNHKGTILKYISSPLVLCRGDNDFFVSSGMAKRIKIDFIGYLKLSNDLYTESCSITQALHGVLLRERPWLYTSLAMACYGNQEDKRHLLYYYEEMGYSKFLTEFIFLWGGLARYLKNSGKLKSFIRKIKL
ncbi:glycosyltransferase family 2 protein [Xenorhabdus indica]|uniref:glycosyltransferase family 2 protein n=1 Tax=Xenorhabdus indica TaxID=333964 RepID=UPI001656F765|nr:glycosyltransferase family 2 protein [Xenorhabdus indica]MBC8945599.1 glycosyltransferase [Xenorhabdus indica]MBC8945768.1 glycosyltransferase [Xenorhabdus indica]